MKEFQVLLDNGPHTPVAENYMARLHFQYDTAAAYERVSRMPWLPLQLPETPVEKPVYRCSMALAPESLVRVDEILDSLP